MKARFLVCRIVVLILAMFIASASFAECPPGNIEVTIVNPSGKVMEICVGEAAVDHIGGPRLLVIPAVCPCDVALLQPPESWPDLEDLSLIVWDNEEGGDGVWVGTDSPFDCFGVAFYDWVSEEGECAFYGPGGNSGEIGTDPDETHACAALVWAFAVYELGLDCVGEFPDFEPPPPPTL